LRVRVLRNEDVSKIIAFIPPRHIHTRVALFIGDDVLILQQATVDALIRAYASVALHPTRRAIELTSVKLFKGARKDGFAEYQLIESGRPEDEVLNEITKLYYGDETRASDS